MKPKRLVLNTGSGVRKPRLTLGPIEEESSMMKRTIYPSPMKGLGIIQILLGMALSGCGEAPDPAHNPLLTQPIQQVAPELLRIEKIVRTQESSAIPLLEEDQETSIFYVCSVDPSHFETEAVPGHRNCQRLFKSLAKEARANSKILGTLKLSDLNDRQAEERLHGPLFKLMEGG
jgi:hypothetical protein